MFHVFFGLLQSMPPFPSLPFQWLIYIFLEFLAFNKVSHSSIANYLSAIKTKMTMLGLNLLPFEDQKIKYFTKAMTCQAPLKVQLITIIDISMLHDIAKHCDFSFLYSFHFSVLYVFPI